MGSVVMGCRVFVGCVRRSGGGGMVGKISTRNEVIAGRSNVDGVGAAVGGGDGKELAL